MQLRSSWSAFLLLVLRKVIGLLGSVLLCVIGVVVFLFVAAAVFSGDSSGAGNGTGAVGAVKGGLNWLWGMVEWSFSLWGIGDNPNRGGPIGM